MKVRGKGKKMRSGINAALRFLNNFVSIKKFQARLSSGRKISALMYRKFGNPEAPFSRIFSKINVQKAAYLFILQKSRMKCMNSKSKY